MTRLELIMTDKDTLTADDARELLSDYVEGALDADTRARVDALLAQDASLRAELQALERTVGALRALPAPAAPPDMVAKVRARLADERRAESGHSERAVTGGVLVPRSRFRWGGVEAAIGLAAAASVALFVMVVGVPGASRPGDDTQTAGMGALEGAREVTLVAPGFTRDTLVELATRAGMDTITAEAFEGEGRAAARFVLMLKSEAVVRGVEISGVVPEAARVRLVIKTDR